MEEREISASKKTTVIIGAGPSGLAAAYQLAIQGESVTVIEREEFCGGSHRSFNIGPYTFDSGSFFFEAEHPYFDMFDGLRELCLPIVRSQGRITPDGTVQRYPFEPREALNWSIKTQFRTLLDLVFRKIIRSRPKNAEDVCVSRLGRTAYEVTGLAGYIERLNHVHPSEIDVIFCQKRMKFVLKNASVVSIGRSVLRNLRGKSARSKKQRGLLVRPAEGFEPMYDVIRGELEGMGVKFLLGIEIERIERENNSFCVSTPSSEIVSDNLVGAIPVDTLHRAAFNESTELEGLDLLTLFMSVSDIRKFEGNVLFNFSNSGDWKRITIFSRIYGLRNDREYFSVEFTLRGYDKSNEQSCFEEFKNDVDGLEIFSEDLSLEGFDLVRDAYPLYRIGFKIASTRAIQRLENFGVAMVGRQGRFDYLPVSSKVVEKTREHLTSWKH